MIKKILIISATAILLLSLYVLYIFSSTGFFRDIEPSSGEQVDMIIKLRGVEDIEVSYEDDFLIFSADDRAAKRYRRPRKAGLYLFDLKNTQYKELTTDLSFAFFPHGISMLKLDSSKFRIWAINHAYRKHSIEVFDLYAPDSLVHRKTLEDLVMISPNDVVAIDEEQFYFTNDHGFTSKIGLLAENYLGLRASNVVFYDGDTYREVADGIAYANGINFDADREIMYVASPRDFLVKVYDRKDNGELVFVENIACGTGVDNIEIDPEGKLWIGCHPDLLHFTRYAAGKIKTSPSELLTIDYREKGDYSVNSIFLDDGMIVSGSTVAVPIRYRIFVGSVMDDHVLVLRNKKD